MKKLVQLVFTEYGPPVPPIIITLSEWHRSLVKAGFRGNGLCVQCRSCVMCHRGVAKDEFDVNGVHKTVREKLESIRREERERNHEYWKNARRYGVGFNLHPPSGW